MEARKGKDPGRTGAVLGPSNQPSGRPCCDAAGVFELLTPPGEGGIAVFGLEGGAVRQVLASAIGSSRLAELRPGEMAYGRMKAEDGSVLDEVIVACLPPRAEHSERFELNCHAGGAAAGAAAERLEALGLCRGALRCGPGVSALEAQFREALGNARTRRQATALAAARNELFPEIERTRALLESPGGAERAAAALDAVMAESQRLAQLLKTHRVALIGPVNAGKSTLLNRLAGADRAITSPHPGTTRDAVEASIALNGLAVDLVDTAGLGSGASGELARRSEALALNSARSADLCLLVLDPSTDIPESEIERLRAASSGRLLTIGNKSDLSPPEHPHAALRISARTGSGVPLLLAQVERALLADPPRGAAAVPSHEAFTTVRRAYTCTQRAAVENAPEAVREAAGILDALGDAPV